MSLDVIVCSKVSAVSSTVAMWPWVGFGDGHRGEQHPHGYISRVVTCGERRRASSSRSGTMFRVSATLSRALDAVLDGLPADALRRATASSSTSTAAVPRRPPRCCATPRPPPPTRPTGCRPPTPRCRGPCGTRRHWTPARRAVGRRRGRRTGAATWAVAEAFPGLERATVLDGSADALALGQRIARHGGCRGRRDVVLLLARCRSAGGGSGGGQLRARRAAGRSTRRSSTRRPAPRLALVIEPGTAWVCAVLAARSRLTGAGWHLLAPLPRTVRARWPAAPTGAAAPRLDRSGLHRGSRAASAGTRTRSSPTCWPP